MSAVELEAHDFGHPQKAVLSFRLIGKRQNQHRFLDSRDVLAKVTVGCEQD